MWGECSGVFRFRSVELGDALHFLCNGLRPFRRTPFQEEGSGEIAVEADEGVQGSI